VAAGVVLAGLLLWGILGALPARAAEPGGDQASRAPEQRVTAVRITGNHALAEAALREAAAQELLDFQTKGFKNAAADDAAYQMERAYRQTGYRFATVDYSLERSADDGLSLTFVVKEGVRVRIKEIVLTGNSTVASERLRGFFAAQAAESPVGAEWFVESRIAAAVDEIRTHYYVNGYLQSVVADPQFTFSADRSTVTVRVTIVEGVPFVVHDLLFSGDLLPEVAEALAGIKDSLLGEPYVPRRIAVMLESRVVELYGDRGYPDARAEVVRAGAHAGAEFPGAPGEQVNGAVVLAVRIVSGPRVTISGVRITGQVKTREEFILSRLTMAPGDIYSAAQKRSSFSRLYRTGLFALVRISLAAGEQPGRRLLLVELEELPGREVSVEVGWGSYEMLRGKVEARNRNFTGKGRILSASAAASLKSTDLSLGFADPWFLGHDLGLDLPLYYRTRTEPSFDRTEQGISTVFSKHFPKPRVGVSLAYALRYTQQSDISVAVFGAGDDYNFASLKLQVTRDTRDDLFFPASGYRSIMAVEHTDKTLGSSLAFVRFTTTNRFFFSLGPRTVLATRYDTGFVVPTTEDLTLPLAERFFNGGASTVRSFREAELGLKDQSTGDPLGGSAYNVVTLELRRRFKHNLGGSIFLDYGNIAPASGGGIDQFADRSDFVSSTFSEYFSNFRPAIGVGIQYILPVGPLRIDVAYNPSVDETQRENRVITHFTVGMAF
jgi:outer membrane protein assembly complex protein YaeT